MIIEESERRNQKGGRNTRAKPKTKDGDEAMSVTPAGTSGRGCGNGRGGRRGGNSNGQGRQHPPCWNCGSREHFKADCTQPATDKSADSKALVVKGSAHVVDDVDSEDDGVFAVVGKMLVAVCEICSSLKGSAIHNQPSIPCIMRGNLSIPKYTMSP